jgi:hypothetical protein
MLVISASPTNANSQFYDEGIQLEDVSSEIAELQRTFFSNDQKHFGSDLSQDIFSIARHVAQTNTAPRFFNFDERERHDLDLVAEDLISKDLSRRHEDDACDWNSIGRIAIGRCSISPTSFSRASTMVV